MENFIFCAVYYSLKVIWIYKYIDLFELVVS